MFNPDSSVIRNVSIGECIKNCMIFPSLLFVLLLSSCIGEGEHQRTNVLLILVDTVTADHLGCYGYYRNTSPTIDSLAASGTIFMNCLAQSSWTLPGMASIYTGLSERSHRCGQYNDRLFGLDLEMPTVSTILQEQGYSTSGFVQSSFLGVISGWTKVTIPSGCWYQKEKEQWIL